MQLLLIGKKLVNDVPDHFSFIVIAEQIETEPQKPKAGQSPEATSHVRDAGQRWSCIGKTTAWTTQSGAMTLHFAALSRRRQTHRRKHVWQRPWARARACDVTRTRACAPLKTQVQTYAPLIKTQTCTPAHLRMYVRAHKNSRTSINARRRTHARAHTHTHTRTPSLIHTHTNANTSTFTHKHTRTRARARSVQYYSPYISGNPAHW